MIYDPEPMHDYDYNSDSERHHRLGEEAESWIKAKAAYIKNLEAELAGVRSAAKPLSERIEGLEEKVESERAKLLDMLRGFGFVEVRDPRFVIKLKSSKYVHVDPEATIPPEYIREKTVKTPDLLSIRRDLDVGAVISGCSLAERHHLTIK